MLFGSIDIVFGPVQGSDVGSGDFIGTLPGRGTGSPAGLFSNVLEAIYAGSGQEISL